MITFVCGIAIGWILSRSYKTTKSDAQEMITDIKSLFGRSSKKDE